MSTRIWFGSLRWTHFLDWIAIATVAINEMSWSLYEGSNKDMAVYSFLASSTTESF